MAGLEAGRDAGGQGGDLYERSATLVVAETDTFPDIDLRIDFHATRPEPHCRDTDQCEPHGQRHRKS